MDDFLLNHAKKTFKKKDNDTIAKLLEYCAFEEIYKTLYGESQIVFTEKDTLLLKLIKSSNDPLAYLKNCAKYFNYDIFTTSICCCNDSYGSGSVKVCGQTCYSNKPFVLYCQTVVPQVVPYFWENINVSDILPILQHNFRDRHRGMSIHKIINHYGQPFYDLYFIDNYFQIIQLLPNDVFEKISITVTTENVQKIRNILTFTNIHRLSYEWKREIEKNTWKLMTHYIITKMYDFHVQNNDVEDFLIWCFGTKNWLKDFWSVQTGYDEMLYMVSSMNIDQIATYVLPHILNSCKTECNYHIDLLTHIFSLIDCDKLEDITIPYMYYSATYSKYMTLFMEYIPNIVDDTFRKIMKTGFPKLELYHIDLFEHIIMDFLTDDEYGTLLHTCTNMKCFERLLSFYSNDQLLHNDKDGKNILKSLLCGSHTSDRYNKLILIIMNIDNGIFTQPFGEIYSFKYSKLDKNINYIEYAEHSDNVGFAKLMTSRLSFTKGAFS